MKSVTFEIHVNVVLVLSKHLAPTTETLLCFFATQLSQSPRRFILLWSETLETFAIIYVGPYFILLAALLILLF